MRWTPTLLLAAGLVGVSLPVQALQLAGTAVEVDPNAVAAINDTPRHLASGDELFMGEQVVTTQSGLVQIVFNDNTRMVVGPNSALLIQEYLLRNDQSVSRFTVNALGGTFRFITGDSDHNVYEIKTPTGTIGVRGTLFDFDVDWNTGEVLKILFSGGTHDCNAAGHCTNVEARCQLSFISLDRGTGIQDIAEQRLRDFRHLFPLTGSGNNRLRRDFRIANVEDCSPARREFTLPENTSTTQAAVEEEPPVVEEPEPEEPEAEEPEEDEHEGNPRPHWRPHPHFPHWPHWPHFGPGPGFDD